jgi:sn-glycerol 3-phosphate transport system ATP-binding protein
MNLFPLERRDTGMVVRGTEGPVLAPPLDGAVTGGIRPEHMRLAETGIPAVVRDAEYLGADTVLACVAGDATLLVRLPGRVVPPEGTPVHLAFDESVHLFDTTTGQRMASQPELAR